MSDLTVRSLGRAAKTENLIPTGADVDRGKSKTVALGGRSASGQEVAKARGVGDTANASPMKPPPSGDRLVANKAVTSARVRFSPAAGSKPIESQYSVLDSAAVRENSASSPRGNLHIGARGNARVGNQQAGNFTPVASPNPSYVSIPTGQGSSGGYDVSLNRLRGGAGATGTERSAPPLPFRSNDFLPGGGIDPRAVRQREVRENLYLAANSFSGGTAIRDRQASIGKASASRLGSVKKFFQSVKKLFTRSVQVAQREVSSEKSRFGEEVVIRGINQRLGKKDQSRAAKLGKEVENIVNKGRNKGEITQKQHILIAQKRDSIENIFRQDAQNKGGAIAESPTYESVDGDYGRIRQDRR